MPAANKPLKPVNRAVPAIGRQAPPSSRGVQQVPQGQGQGQGQDLSNLTTQGGQFGVVGRGGNFQPLGRNAQGRVDAVMNPGMSQPPSASGPPMMRSAMYNDTPGIDQMTPQQRDQMRNVYQELQQGPAQSGLGGGAHDIASAISSMRQSLGHVNGGPLMGGPPSPASRGIIPPAAGAGGAGVGGAGFNPSGAPTKVPSSPYGTFGAPTVSAPLTPYSPKMISAGMNGTAMDPNAGAGRAQFNNRFSQLINRGRGMGGGRMGGG